MALYSDETVGLAKETTYGTPVVVSRFLEAPGASLSQTPTFTQGSGTRPGLRAARASRRPLTKLETAGDLTMDVPTRGLGMVLAAFFGVNTSTALPGTPTVFQQVHTPKHDGVADSYTIQTGIPKPSGVDAFTFPGMQCGSLSIEAQADGIVSMTTSWVGNGDMSRQTPYAAPSWPAEMDLLTFVGGKIYVGTGAFTAPTTTALASAVGTELATIKSWKASFDNGLDSGGWNLGGQGKRRRAARYTGNSEKFASGSLTAEYEDRTLVDAYLDATNLVMIATFEGPAEIAAGVKPCLQFAMPLVHLESGFPAGNSGDVITVDHDWTGFTPATGEPVYCVYRTLDTAL